MIKSVWISLLVIFSFGTVHAQQDPIAVDDLVHIEAGTTVTLDYLHLNDTDADKDVLEMDPASGIVYTPPAGFTGVDTISYVVKDSTGRTATGSVRIAVNAPIDVVSARAQLFSGVANMPARQPRVLKLLAPTALKANCITPKVGKEFVYTADKNTYFPDEPLVGVATMGSGRIIALPDSMILKLDQYGDVADGATFIMNGLAWLTDSTGLDISIVTCRTEDRDWLVAKGYTAVTYCTTSTLATGLASADVFFAGYLNNNYMGNIATIDAFVKTGGGLFITDQGSTDIGNLLLVDAGIAFDPTWHDTFSVISASLFPQFEMTGERALTVLADPMSYSIEEYEVAGFLLGKLFRNFPYNHTIRARYRAAIQPAIEQYANVNPVTPLKISANRLGAFLMRADYDIVYNTPLDFTKEHHSVAELYGSIAPDAERVMNEVVAINGNRTRWQMTGLYVAPGDVVTITVPQNIVGVGCQFVVNSNDDPLFNRNDYRRFNVVSRTFDITSTTVRIANAFGGGIYLDLKGVDKDGPPNTYGPFDITVSGAVRLPWFKLGRDTNEDWNTRIRDYPGRTIVLDSTNIVITVPKLVLNEVNLVDPHLLIERLCAGQSAMDDMTYFTPYRQTAHVCNSDVQIGFGAAHAGYPIQIGGFAKDLVDIDAIRKGADINMLYHELGHAHGKRWWQVVDPRTGWIDGHVSFALYNLSGDKAVLDNPDLVPGWSGRYNNMKYAIEHARIASDTGLPYREITANTRSSYLTVPYHAFGAEVFKKIYKAFWDDNLAEDANATTLVRSSQYYKRASLMFGYDMTLFYEGCMGWFVDPAVRAEIAHLPKWMPVLYRPEDICVPLGSKIELHTDKMYTIDGVKNLINVVPPNYGRVWKRPDGTWWYDAMYNDLSTTEPLVYEVQSSAGNTVVFTNQLIVAEDSPGIYREIWCNNVLKEKPRVSGSSVASLVNNVDYPNNPYETYTVDMIEVPGSFSSDYGVRFRTALKAPETGNYTFWIASDDSSQLFLSTDEDPDGRTLISEVTSATQPNEWDASPSQQSVSIALVAGERYHLEVIYKQSRNDHHLSLAWATPSNPNPVVIGAEYFKFPTQYLVGGNYPSADGLIVHYLFDAQDVTLVRDYIGNNFPGTLSGGTWQPDNGIQNGSLSLDGVNDGILVPSDSQINTSTVVNRSIGLWFRADALTGKQMLFEEGGTGNGLNIYLDGTTLYMGAWGSETHFINTTGLNAGQWYHAMLVLDQSTGQLKGYLDATEFAAVSSPSIPAHSDSIGMGQVQGSTKCDSSYSGFLYFGGDLDNFVLYNRALSSTEIVELSQINQAPSISDATFTITENIAVDSTVGTVVSSDPDVGDIRSHYIVSGDEKGVFAINSLSGEITVASTVDYETAISYNLIVEVSDQSGKTDQATVTINIIDIVNDDSDSDGLTDEWEITNFGSIDAYDASDDPDQDNATNGIELEIGTDPNDSTQPSGSLFHALHAWWKLDETTGSSAHDSTKNGFDLDIWHTPQLGQPGAVDNAFAFNGSDTLRSPSGVTTRTNFTISAWINPSSVSGTQTILSKEWSFNFGLKDNTLWFEAVGKPEVYTSSATLLANQWQHVAVSFSPETTSGCKFYHNGVLVKSINSAKFNDRSNRFWVAESKNGERYDGRLDDIRFYNRLINPEEVTALYQKNDAWSSAPTLQDANYTIPENHPIGTPFGVLSATDPDGDTLSFSISEGNQYGIFTIDSNTGELSLVTGLNYETLRSHTLTVSVSDGSLDTTATVQIFVTNVDDGKKIYLSDINWIVGGNTKKDKSTNNNPIILDGITYPKGLGVHAPSEITYDLAGNYVTFHSIIGVDDETSIWGSVIFEVYGDDVLLYQSAVINADGTETLDVNVTGVQTLKLVVDTNGNGGSDHADWADAFIVHEKVYLSDMEWQSESNGWNGSVRKDSSIDDNTIRLDEIPYVKGLGTHAPSEIVYNLAGNYVSFHSVVGIDDETGTDGSVIFKVYGDNVLLHQTAVINATGTETIDLDITGVQSLKLVADINGSSTSDHADWADASLQRKGGWINEGITANDTAFLIAENSALNTAVGTVSATDPAGKTLTYSITAGNDTGTFAINSATGEITLASPLDYETTPSFVLFVSVTNGDYSDTANISITATNVNEAPVAANTNVSISDDAALGAAVGSISVNDPDVGDTLAYSITSGNGDGKFAIDSVTGVITVAGTLNTYTTAAYSLVVSVSDGAFTDTATVAITITTNFINPRVYLSDINWVSQTTGWGGDVKKDLSIQSNPIVLDGITYPKGLGTHAQSEIIYNLESNSVTFHSIVGVNDETGSSGSVIFKVYGDDVLLYETAVINATGTETLNIDVVGIQTLKLVADANGSDAHDHADWADAYILLDTDSDGLTDEWENTHFGIITAQDGAGDPDNDGVSNRQEQTFGTDPMDANDAPSAEYINLRGWWKFDESAGTLAADSSGNGLNAVNTNGVLVSQSGKVNGAFAFDGNDDSAATQETDAPGSDLTITAWIHPDNLSGEQSIIAKNSSFTLKLNGSAVRFTTPGHRDHIGSGAFIANTWQFVAVTFTPSATGGCRFYRNGAFLNAIDSSGIDQNSNPIDFGKNQWGQYFDGQLDDIRLYDRVLTAAEINALYQQNDGGIYTLWKGTKFTATELTNPAISGDAADVDDDQLSTLVEYALGLDPKGHNGSFAGCAIKLDGANGWKVEFNRHASRNDIDLVLEWSDELNPANWQPVAESIAGGVVQALNGATLVSEIGSEPTIVELNVPSTVPHGFIRWTVERR